ncbi:MAG: ABC transporter permease [Candidatus Dormibacteria bacterium]
MLRRPEELPLPLPAARSFRARAWSVAWPRAAAVLIGLAAWEALTLAAWKPSYVLPGPAPVAQELLSEMATPALWQAIAITLTRALEGFALAILVGSGLGVAMAALTPLRTAFGSLITGMQTMPSISWFPLAILLFQLNDSAILYVVVLGAAPSLANGILSGIDHVAPEVVRVGRVLGARGARLYASVIIPAAMPSVVGGLKQGWAFAWRSLMAGELLVNVAGRPSLGVRLQEARDQADAAGLIATMIIILVIGILVDALFSAVDRRVRRNRGLLLAVP